MDTEIDDLTSAFVVPEGNNHPAIIFERLLTHAEHKHIRENEITVEFLFRAEPKSKGGKSVLGSVHLPTCQGVLRDLFEWLLAKHCGYMPHFLCVLDLGFWESVDPNIREALLWHEMCHIKQDLDQYGAPKFNKQTGEPTYGLVEHDITAFNSEVERYGSWSPDIEDFLQAARRHGV